MKKTAFLIVFFLLFAAVGSINASDKSDFRVLISKGEIMVQKNGAGDWLKIASGSKLSTTDKIQIAKGAYIGLSYLKGGTYEIKEAGTYNLKDIAAKITSQKKGIPQEFYNYVSSEFSKADDMTKKQNQQLSGLTGAVTRDFETGKKNASSIMLESPRKMSLLAPTITLKWMPLESAEGYLFNLYDKDSREILSKKVTSNEITLNLNDLNLKCDTFYFWNVKADNNPSIKSGDACFTLLSDEKSKNILGGLSNLKAELGAEESSPLKQLMVAAYYEKNGLMLEAQNIYISLLKSDPEVKEYHAYYELFKEKMNSLE